MTRLTVWHDGACPLCRREIALMPPLDRSGAIRFIDATTDDIAAPSDGMRCWHASMPGRMA